jgi:hypothetical protein
LGGDEASGDRSDDGNDSASTDDSGDGNDVDLFSKIAVDEEKVIMVSTLVIKPPPSGRCLVCVTVLPILLLK